MSDTRRPFKIAAAQIASIRGDVAANVARHEAALRAAAAAGVSVVVFPELSLIGYEPDIAASLAFTDDDIRLEPLRRLMLEHPLTTMIGAPMRTEDKRQFTDATRGFVPLQVTVLGSIFIANGTVICVLYALGASWLGAWLKTRYAVATWLNRAMGGLFVGLGLRLAFGDRR